jgi:hypothetical protein
MARRRKTSKTTRAALIRTLRRAAELSMEFSDERDNLDALSLPKLRKVYKAYMSNPYKEDRFYADREIRAAKRAKRSKHRRHTSKRGLHAMLGRMNPRPHKKLRRKLRWSHGYAKGTNERGASWPAQYRKHAAKLAAKGTYQHKGRSTFGSTWAKRMNPNARKIKVASRRRFQHKYEFAKKVAAASNRRQRSTSAQRSRYNDAITGPTKAYYGLSRLKGEFVKRGTNKHLIKEFGWYLEPKNLPKRARRGASRNPRARPNENEIPTVIIRRKNPPISAKEAAVLKAVLKRHGYRCNPVVTNPGRKRKGRRR